MKTNHQNQEISHLDHFLASLLYFSYLPYKRYCIYREKLNKKELFMGRLIGLGVFGLISTILLYLFFKGDYAAFLIFSLTIFPLIFFSFYLSKRDFKEECLRNDKINYYKLNTELYFSTKEKESEYSVS